MRIIVVALLARPPAALVESWRTRIGPRGTVAVLGLSGATPGDHDGIPVRPVELDPERLRPWPQFLACGRGALVVAAGWRWLGARLLDELSWNLRSLDPDVVDLRAVPALRGVAEALRARLAPITVVANDADVAGATVSAGAWRRYDPTTMVSVVLPVYNGARYLDQAIASCLAQTHRALELVVVDDASTDDTPAIVARHAARDPRVIARRNDRNLRLPATLNVGFRVATGPLLTWTSHDNYYEPPALETLVRYLDTWNDVDLVYSDYYRLDAQDRGIRVHLSPPWLLRWWNTVGAFFMFRRAVYEGTGEWRTDMEFVEDYEYWVRAAKRFRMMRLGEPLYYYREHADSMSSRSGDVTPLRRRLRREHYGRA